MNSYLEKIINIANERGIPLTILCENAGLAKNTIANWKRGSEPSMDKVIKILKYLGVSADEIFDISSPIKRTEKSVLIAKYISDLKYIKTHVSILSGEDDIYEMIRDADQIMKFIDEQIEKYKNI